VSDAAAPGDLQALGGAAEARAARLVRAMLERDAYSRWLGVELVRVAPDAVTVRMTVRPEMLNGFGVCHGGVTFALADSALAFASNTHGTVTLSVENAIRYPVPVHAGDVLTADAEEEGGGRRLRFFRVVVRRQDGDTVAIFRGTVYRTRQPLLPDEPASESS
jgi:acyl-CoA thioesterase